MTMRSAIVGLLCMMPVAASAQKIHPDCMKMRDKIGGTCALKNGGGIKANGTWYSVPGPNNRPRNQAFTDCVARGGRN